MKYADVSESLLKTTSTTDVESEMVAYLTEKYGAEFKDEYTKIKASEKMKTMRAVNARVASTDTTVSLEEVIASTDLSPLEQDYLFELSVMLLSNTDSLENLYTQSQTHYYSTINTLFDRFVTKINADKSLINNDKEVLLTIVSMQRDNIKGFTTYLETNGTANTRTLGKSWFRKVVTVVVSTAVGAGAGAGIQGVPGAVVGGVIGAGTGVTMVSLGKCYCWCGTCSCTTGKC